MRMPRFAKVLVAFLVGVMVVQLLHACSTSQAAEKIRLTIATVNNGDMVGSCEFGAKGTLAQLLQAH